MKSTFEVKGRDRNLPCPCDSGKKWKKCHPTLDKGFVPPVLHRDDPPEKMEAIISNYLIKRDLPKPPDNLQFPTVKEVIKMDEKKYKLVEVAEGGETAVVEGTLAEVEAKVAELKTPPAGESTVEAGAEATA
jgi:hypothetical protein